MSELFTASATITASSDAALLALIRQGVGLEMFRLPNNDKVAMGVTVHTHLHDDPEPYDISPVDYATRTITLAHGQYASVQHWLAHIASQSQEYQVSALAFCEATPEIITFHRSQILTTAGADDVLALTTDIGDGVKAFLQGGYEALDNMDDCDECETMDEVDRLMNKLATKQLDKMHTQETQHGS